MLSVSEIEQLRIMCGMRVRFLRRQNDLTQEQLAKHLCMQRSRLSRIECGMRPANYDELAQMVHEFDLSFPDFFTGIVLPSHLERYVVKRHNYVDEREMAWRNADWLHVGATSI